MCVNLPASISRGKIPNLSCAKTDLRDSEIVYKWTVYTYTVLLYYCTLIIIYTVNHIAYLCYYVCSLKYSTSRMSLKHDLTKHNHKKSYNIISMRLLNLIIVSINEQ